MPKNKKNYKLSTIKKIFFVFALFFVFFFNQRLAHAGSLSLSATPSTIDPNGNSKITATTSDNKQGIAISFKNSDTRAIVTPISCVTSSEGSCSVDFTSSTNGLYNIGVVASGYDAGLTTIRVGPPVVELTPTAKQTQQTETAYTPLAPLPGLGDAGCTGTDANGKPAPCIKTTVDCAFGNYLNIMIKLIIGLIAVIAVVMITIGGLEYMTSELVSSKEAGKDRIKNAILGIIIALGAYLILNTVNPDLLNVCLKIEPQTITVGEPEPGINAKSITVTDQVSGSNITVNACDESQMKVTNVFGQSVKVYKGLVNSLQTINQEWLDKGGNNFYKINTIEGYNCRDVTNKPGYKSAHAFGMAVDINPITNPYGQTLKTDMPSDFRQLFLDEGWGWGGDWANVKDAMHFSALNGEHGDNTVQIFN